MSVKSPLPLIAQNNNLQIAHTLAKKYAEYYHLPYRLALSVALQQTPRKGEQYPETGNQWLICHITYFAEKYQEEITRLCHIVDFQPSANHLRVFDLERNEDRTPKIKHLKKIELVKMGAMVNLTREHEYIETLVYGLPTTEFDRIYKYRQESGYYDHQENLMKEHEDYFCNIPDKCCQ